MEIKLKRLRIENFKGIAKKEIEFRANTCISGANATGKTSVFDAFTFLLFGKNSKGEEKFAMRPVDASGAVIHNIEIVLDGEFDIVDGDSSKSMTLKKVSKEKWVKRRGSDVAELQGNENSYEVDGYPRSEREYKEIIAGLLDEKVFKLITDPKAFPNLPWKEQRAFLMNLIAKQSDAEMARAMGGYLEIIDELEKAPSTDDIVSKYKKQLSELKKQQDELPVRIDEVSKQIVLAETIAGLKREQKDLSDRVNGIVLTDFAAKAYDARIRKEHLESELKLANSKFDHEQSEKQYAAKAEIRAAEDKLSQLKHSFSEAADSEQRYSAEISRIKNELAKTEHDLDELSQRQMDDSKTYCPVCGRKFSEKKIEKIKDNFYKEINSKMIFVSSQIDELKKEFAAANRLHDECLNKQEELKEQMRIAFADLDAKQKAYQEPESVSFVDTDDFKSLIYQIKAAEDEAAKYQAEEEKQNSLKRERQELSFRLAEVEKQIESANATNDQIEARIAELREEQMSVAQKTMDCEKMLNLVEKFIREKMDLITSKINERFDGVLSWKMFDMQLNGGMKETCECTINGVPYGSANNGHQIIAGLQIIKVLQEEYGVKAPIFIDNAESVNTFNYPYVDSQMVFLKVTDDKELTVKSA